jgi:hypothetical protein
MLMFLPVLEDSKLGCLVAFFVITWLGMGGWITFQMGWWAYNHVTITREVKILPPANPPTCWYPDPVKETI